MRVDMSVTAIPMKDEYRWSGIVKFYLEMTKGYVLSSFFWGYIIVQVPGGWLSTKYGGVYLFYYHFNL